MKHAILTTVLAALVRRRGARGAAGHVNQRIVCRGPHR